ncbi:MAG: N-acetylmuramic acid 6-phosphate etherase [Lachnospiraceae bacterium]
MLDLQKMTTETRNQNTLNLDTMTPLEVISAMNKEDAIVPKVIEGILPQIATLVEWVIEGFLKGGRLIYIGAGTSGRLGVLDAAECPPTFGVPSTMVVGLIAGGERAFIQAVEGAEDNKELGKQDLINIKLTQNDVVVGIAASGRTPYVLGALEYANNLGVHTAAISCNGNSEVGKKAELAIEAVVGPEVLTGSTRLKAGTAQKMILNMISTASMVGIGKSYENLMIDVMLTNKKLHVRAENIVIEATGVTRKEAQIALEQAEGSAKVAIAMLLISCDAKEAREKLEYVKGHVRKALN